MAISNHDFIALLGQKLYGQRGERIGRIEGIYYDEVTEQPEWLLVTTGWFGSKRSFVPLEGVIRLGDELVAPHDEATVRGAPTVEADGALSPEEEVALYGHYGLSAEPARVSVMPGEPERAGLSSVLEGEGQDVALSRAEEELRIEVLTQERGRARLRKWVETERVTESVPVAHEELRVVREPLTPDGSEHARGGADIGEDLAEVTLHEERVVVAKEVVPKERVRLEKVAVTDHQPVEAELRKERIELEEDDSPRAE